MTSSISIPSILMAFNCRYFPDTAAGGTGKPWNNESPHARYVSSSDTITKLYTLMPLSLFQPGFLQRQGRVVPDLEFRGEQRRGRGHAGRLR